MKILENTLDRLVLRSESILTLTVCTFDRSADVARIAQPMLFWRRPHQIPLAEIEHVNVFELKDPASGVTAHIPVIHTSTGRTIALSRKGEANATDIADRLRDFLRPTP